MSPHSNRLSLCLLALLPLQACNSPAGSASDHGIVTDLDQDQRDALFSPLQALAGSWTISVDGEEMGASEISVGAAGSAVREVMFPGMPHEMTNMYTLDGDELAMTHYCGGGNQPYMRASKIADGRIEFRASGVRDLDAPDEAYMGALTLVMVDDDHVEEHWTSFVGDAPIEEHSMVIRLRRLP